MKKRRAWMIAAASLILGASVLVWNAGRSPQDEVQDAWINAPPNSVTSSSNRIPREDVYYIAPENDRAASDLLQKQPCVLLENAESKVIAPALSLKPGWKPYLVRSVSTGDPTSQCIACTSGKSVLWMDCGILTHSPVRRLEHTPVVVFLKLKPKTVYVTFSVAE